MNLLLVYRNQALGAAWEGEFAELSNIKIVEGDICDLVCDAMVSPANNFGFMDGGLNFALSKRFGWDLQEKLQA